MKRTLYSNDIDNACKLRDSLNLTNAEVINLYRLNSRQAEDLTNEKSNNVRVPYTSAFGASKTGPKMKKIGIRTVEACAALYYRGFSQKEMAEALGCDNTTLSHALAKYPGYARVF